jgi:hypothetical protein
MIRFRSDASSSGISLDGKSLSVSRISGQPDDLPRKLHAAFIPPGDAQLLHFSSWADLEFDDFQIIPPPATLTAALGTAAEVHDSPAWSIAALTSAGLDPFVGFLHVDRPNRPSLALDLMEEFRPWLADRLAVTLINRQQIQPDHFRPREGGAVEFTDAGRKLVIKSYQERKQETFTHPVLDQTWRIAQMPFLQARLLARHLRGDLPEYLPLVPK